MNWLDPMVIGSWDDVGRSAAWFLCRIAIRKMMFTMFSACVTLDSTFSPKKHVSIDVHTHPHRSPTSTWRYHVVHTH